MARPKRVPRRLPRGADRASQGEGASGQGEEAASSSRPLSQARNRRYEAHSCVLRELRRIERHMQPAIPRLPFQRLVREICEQWSPNLRWTASGLLCLQEVAEDWLVAFFEDSYLLAAHAHRLTIFPRDFEVLRRIRYRYDQLLVPGVGIDRRAQEILTVPPLHPRARVAEPSQAVHNRATRSLIQRRQAAQVSAESTPPAGHASAEPTPPATAAATPSVPIDTTPPLVSTPNDPTPPLVSTPLFVQATEAATATDAQAGSSPDVLMTETEPTATATVAQAGSSADVLMTETEPTATATEAQAGCSADVLIAENLASNSTDENHYGRTRDRELREMERLNLVQLDDLSNHGDVRLAFTLGDEQFSRKLVGTLTQEDLMVLVNPDIISVTDSLMQPLLWYVSLLLCYFEHIWNRGLSIFGHL